MSHDSHGSPSAPPTHTPTSSSTRTTPLPSPGHSLNGRKNDLLDPIVVAKSGATTPRSRNYSSSSSPRARPFSIEPPPYAVKPPIHFQHESPLSPLMGSYTWWRLKRLAARPLPWAIIIVIGLITWWSAGASTEFDSEDVQLRLRELFPPEFTRDLQFFPASNHKIHVSGPSVEELRCMRRKALPVTSGRF